jgi:hypothetical protein
MRNGEPLFESFVFREEDVLQSVIEALALSQRSFLARENTSGSGIARKMGASLMKGYLASRESQRTRKSLFMIYSDTL